MAIFIVNSKHASEYVNHIVHIQNVAVFVELPCGNHHSVQWLYNFKGIFLWKVQTSNFAQNFVKSEKMSSFVSEQVQTLQVQLFPVCTLPDRGINTLFFLLFTGGKNRNLYEYTLFPLLLWNKIEIWGYIYCQSISEHVQCNHKQLTTKHNLF